MKKRFSKIIALLTAVTLTAGAYVGGVIAPSISCVSAASNISESQARKIALRNADATVSEVYALDSYESYAKGKEVYHVSFYKKKSGRNYTHYV